MKPASHTAPAHSGDRAPVCLRLSLVRRRVRRLGSACAPPMGRLRWSSRTALTGIGRAACHTAGSSRWTAPNLRAGSGWPRRVHSRNPFLQRAGPARLPLSKPTWRTAANGADRRRHRQRRIPGTGTSAKDGARLVRPDGAIEWNGEQRCSTAGDLDVVFASAGEGVSSEGNAESNPDAS
jgi:hypothetical protein